MAVPTALDHCWLKHASEHSLTVQPQGGMIKKSALFHTVGMGQFTVEADRQVLGGVVQELIRVRTAFALAVNDLVMFRILQAATAKLLQGDVGVVLSPAESYDEWLKSMHFDDYKNTLMQQSREYRTQYMLRSKCHTIYTVCINKVALSSYDDKRYILDGGLDSLAHGHWRIEHERQKEAAARSL